MQQYWLKTIQGPDFPERNFTSDSQNDIFQDETILFEVFLSWILKVRINGAMNHSISHAERLKI